MRKAILNCPQERVFLKNLLVLLPSLPSRKTEKNNTSKVEVNVIEDRGETSLVLLPTIFTSEKNMTAIVRSEYLN